MFNESKWIYQIETKSNFKFKENFILRSKQNLIEILINNFNFNLIFKNFKYKRIRNQNLYYWNSINLMYENIKHDKADKSKI